MAGLQDKLARSELSTSDQSKMEIPDTRANARKRKPRVNIKPIAVATDEKITENVEEPRVEVETDQTKDIKESNLELLVEPTDVQEVKAGLESSDPILAAIRPVAEYESNKKQKAGFSLRGLFGRSDDQDDASLSIVGSGPASTNSDQENASLNGSFVRTLTEMGLSPNVIVDDGCVIEAANNRSSQGHEAMSRSVITRLSVPVKHFAATLSEDADLSKRTIEFATDFDQKVEKLANDREAIRTRLESETGRAYLICDAALNYGRV